MSCVNCILRSCVRFVIYVLRQGSGYLNCENYDNSLLTFYALSFIFSTIVIFLFRVRIVACLIAAKHVLQFQHAISVINWFFM